MTSCKFRNHLQITLSNQKRGTIARVLRTSRLFGALAKCSRILKLKFEAAMSPSPFLERKMLAHFGIRLHGSTWITLEAVNYWRSRFRRVFTKSP